MVVEHVDDPHRIGVGERDLGGVDLPQVIRELALEALVRLAPPRRLRSDQMVALKSELERKRVGWLLRRGERTAVWRDPRLQRLPNGVGRAVWAVPILIDGRSVRISGELRRVPPPRLWPWLLVVLGAGSVGGLAVGRRRSRVRMACLVLGAVAAVAGIVAAAGFAFEADASGMRVAAVYEFLLAAGGAGFAVWGPREVRVASAGWLGLLGLIGGLACGQVFLHGDVLSVLPATFTRTAAALAIGFGAAASLLTGLFYGSLPNVASSPSYRESGGGG